MNNKLITVTQIAVIVASVGWITPSQLEASIIVGFSTSLGAFQIELFDQAAPNSVANFLAYINNDDYDNSIIHRSQADFSPRILQGGTFFYDGTPQRDPRDFPQITPRTPISNDEAALPNDRGTLAIGTPPDNPIDVTSQWFINLTNNPELDRGSNANRGFTVIGQVLGDGMDIIDAIARINTFRFFAPWGDAPLRNYTEDDFNNERPVDDNNLVLIHDIVIIPEPATVGIILAGCLAMLPRRYTHRVCACRVGITKTPKVALPRANGTPST